MAGAAPTSCAGCECAVSGVAIHQCSALPYKLFTCYVEIKRRSPVALQMQWLFFFPLDFIYLFLEKVREGEGAGGKHQCMVAFCMPPPGTWPTTQAYALDGELNRQPFGLQAGTQSTEPHQPGRNASLSHIASTHSQSGIFQKFVQKWCNSSGLDGSLCLFSWPWSHCLSSSLRLVFTNNSQISSIS